MGTTASWYATEDGPPSTTPSRAAAAKSRKREIAALSPRKANSADTAWVSDALPKLVQRQLHVPVFMCHTTDLDVTEFKKKMKEAFGGYRFVGKPNDKPTVVCRHPDEWIKDDPSRATEGQPIPPIFVVCRLEKEDFRSSNPMEDVEATALSMVMNCATGSTEALLDKCRPKPLLVVCDMGTEGARPANNSIRDNGDSGEVCVLFCHINARIQWAAMSRHIHRMAGVKLPYCPLPPPRQKAADKTSDVARPRASGRRTLDSDDDSDTSDEENEEEGDQP